MLQTPSKTTQTLLSSRIPRDNEHERYHPELEEELKECLFCLQRNAMMFDLEAHLRAAGAFVPLPLPAGPRPGAGAAYHPEKVSAAGIKTYPRNLDRIRTSCYHT